MIYSIAAAFRASVPVSAAAFRAGFGVNRDKSEANAAMRVLVTGAAGWSGSAVVGALLHAGHEVVAHDLVSSWQAEQARAASGDSPAWEVEAPAGSSCERVEGDLLVAGSVRDAVQGCEAVVHTAVLHPPSIDDEDEVNRLTFLVQVNGLFNLLDAVKDTPSVQRFVHVSSCWTAHVSTDPTPLAQIHATTSFFMNVDFRDHQPGADRIGTH
jgi:nucleoside-diphosphate-sugar epimerase